MLHFVAGLLLVQLGLLIYWRWRDYGLALPPLPVGTEPEGKRQPCKHCGKMIDIGRHFVMYDNEMCEFDRAEQLDKAGIEKVVAELLPGWQLERWLWCRRENKPYRYTVTVRKYLRCGLREELPEAFGESGS